MTRKFCNPLTVKLIDLVRDGKRVRFHSYRDKEFWYEHEDGLMFSIPLSEVDDPITKPILLANDKAILFMRWMRKYIEVYKKDHEERSRDKQV